MSVLIWLIPVAIAMGGLGLLAFMWSLKSGQFEDLDGAAERILIDDDKPIVPKATPRTRRRRTPVVPPPVRNPVGMPGRQRDPREGHREPDQKDR